MRTIFNALIQHTAQLLQRISQFNRKIPAQILRVHSSLRTILSDRTQDDTNKTFGEVAAITVEVILEEAVVDEAGGIVVAPVYYQTTFQADLSWVSSKL